MSSLPDILFPEKKEPFSVTDYGSANWTASKAMEATTEIVRLQVQAEAWHQKIDAWLEAASKEYAGTVAHMKLLLAPWTEDELKGVKRRSITLPSARVGFRKSTSLEVTDEAAAVEWLKEHGKTDCVRVKEEVKKDEVKALIKETGEVPEGCVPHEGDTFYIEPVA